MPVIEAIKVKVQPLSAEAFKPYGQIFDSNLENKHLVFPEVDPGDDGRVAIEMRHQGGKYGFEYGSEPKRVVEKMVLHFSYNQTFIPIVGPMVMALAPAPRNREAGPAAYEFDYERVAAFVVMPGQAVFIERGIWHCNYWIGNKQSPWIDITRKNPGEGAGRVTREMNFKQFINFQERDNRIIELELGSFANLLDA